MRSITRSLLAAALLTASACSNLNTTEERALTGGAIGGAGGLVIGAIAGGPLAGVLLGAGAGAAVGATTTEEDFRVDLRPEPEGGPPVALNKKPAKD